MKKALAVILSSVLILSVAGCGGSDSGSSDGGKEKESKVYETVSIDETKLYYPDISLLGGEKNIELKVWAPDNEIPITRAQADAFMKHYPDGTFKNISVEPMDDSDLIESVGDNTEDFADVISFEDTSFSKLMSGKMLSEVSADYIDDVTGQNQPGALNAVTVGNAVSAYPQGTDKCLCLVYDKTAVSDEEASTLEGVLSACKKLGKHFVMDCTDGFSASAFLLTGGLTPDGLESDGTTQKLNDYDENAVVVTLETFSKLMKDYKGAFVSCDSTRITEEFKSKNAAAGIDGSWNMAADKIAFGENFGVTKLPTVNVTGEDRQMISLYGNRYLGVYSNTVFPKAAQALAYFLSTDKSQIQRAQSLFCAPSNNYAVNEVSDESAVRAVLMQLRHSVSEAKLSESFLPSAAKLGESISAESWNPDDKQATQELLHQTVDSITGKDVL